MTHNGGIAQLAPSVEIYALYRAGALSIGQTFRLSAPGLEVETRADGDGLWLGLEHVVVEWEPFLNGKYVRPKFRCPECGVGCRKLYPRTATEGATFVCWRCAGHRQASKSATHLAPLLWARRLRQSGELRERQHLRRAGSRIAALELRAGRGILRMVRGVERRFGHDSGSDPDRER
jgi:hypothetical protein